MSRRLAIAGGTRGRGVAWFVTLFASALAGSAARGSGPEDLETQARRVLLSYDAAWAARDVDGLMASISPTFGCDLYGGVDASIMRMALDSMLRVELPDARCRTRVLSITSCASTVQAFAIREYRGAADALLEHECHVFYLKPEREAGGLNSSLQPDSSTNSSNSLKIVALEEFDPAVLPRIAGPRYLGRDSGLLFTLPKDMFVALPPCAVSVDRVTLRTADLKDEIRIHLRCFVDPFDVEKRLEDEFRTWQKGRLDADARVRRKVTIAGAPGARIDARYHGPSCQLQSRGPEKLLDRTLIRIYVALDARVLLAIDLDAASGNAKSLEATLDELIDSLRIEEPGRAGTTGVSDGYGDRLLARLGYGPLPLNRFEDPDSGLSFSSPPGFSLRRFPSENCFVLEARGLETRGKETLRITIDGIRLDDASLELEYFASFEDLSFADQCDAAGEIRPTIHRASERKGELPVLRVERAIEGGTASKDRVELAWYLKMAGHLVVFDTTVRRDDREHAERTLETFLSRLTTR